MPDMIEFLLTRGAPSNLPDDPPWATPLAWAERRGHAEVAEILRKAWRCEIAESGRRPAVRT